MRLEFKEEPREWRKAAWQGAFGLALLSSVLRWRRVLPVNGWKLALAGLAVAALCAWLYPRWFRGYYRFTTRLAFHVTRVFGCVVLFLLFLLAVTPLGLVLRLLGKDLLQIKPRRATLTTWRKTEDSTALDRMF